MVTVGGGDLLVPSDPGAVAVVAGSEAARSWRSGIIGGSIPKISSFGLGKYGSLSASFLLAYTAGDADTPEGAIQALNVLPQHDSVLAAVLSRGFLEYRPELAIKHGLGLALLPHYPSHVLFDDIYNTLAAAGALGDLPTVELLWNLAGPNSLGRVAWFKSYEGSFVSAAISNSRVPILEWFTRAASTAGIAIWWTDQHWNYAIGAGHTRVFHWAIAQGHPLNIRCSDAFYSARNGDRSVMDIWIARQPSREAALVEMSDPSILAKATDNGMIGSLDCWWEYTGSKLPEPKALVRITFTALTNVVDDGSGLALAVVEWWWTRFLEHRTPNHKFGGPLGIGSLRRVTIRDWFQHHYHEYNDFFVPSPEWDSNPQQDMVIALDTFRGLRSLQWAVEKCAVQSGQKLKLNPWDMSSTSRTDALETLEYIMQHKDVFIVHWREDILPNAIWYGKIKVLEWWDRHQGQLPPQSLIECVQYIPDAAQRDAVDVLAWCHAHQLPVSRDDWQKVCVSAIKYNSRRVQLWLRDHLELFIPESNEDRLAFMDKCMDALHQATTFTLSFFATIFADLDPTFFTPPPMLVYTSMTAMLWFCSRINVTAASFLPLPPSVFESLLRAGATGMLEWWLQAHLAAGVRVVFPAVDTLDAIYENEGKAHRWVYDVMFMRKIAVFVESDDGIVPYPVSEEDVDTF
ncbi:hypothetical protein BC828DRAFT_399654 [Blastocladiella britannica]|nr:hypothetical protein BC828DRAFT_399654 [Blastocladiella britannica]